MRFKDKYYASRSSSNLNDSCNLSLNGHSNGHSTYNEHQNNGIKIDQNSDGSFSQTETDSGTKSRPTSRINCMELFAKKFKVKFLIIYFFF